MSSDGLLAKTATCIAWVVLLSWGAGCAHSEPRAPASTPPDPVTAPAPAASANASAEQDADTGGRGGLVDTPIGGLSLDPSRSVRVVGMVSQLGQIRMIPPRTVFRLRDDSGAVTVVLDERKVLAEGTRIEIVGRYKEIPSPAHVDVDDAPAEACFVAERYLILP